MFDVCTTGDMAHYSSSCHTRVNTLTRVWQDLIIVSMCAVSPVVHTSNISSCHKKTFSVFLWL